MKPIINTKAIEVVVNNADLNNTESLYYKGREILLNESLNDDEQYTGIQDGVKCNGALISTLDPEFTMLILSDAINNNKQGVSITMKNAYQTPYVHIDKSKLDKPFADTEILLKDYTISYVDDIEDETKVYVEIGHYPNGQNRFNYTTWEEIKQWAIEYGIENVKITDKVNDGNSVIV